MKVPKAQKVQNLSIQHVHSMEFIFEFIVTFVFSYPGALVRFLILKLFGSKTTLKECISKDVTQNAFLGFMLAIAVYVCVYSIVS